MTFAATALVMLACAVSALVSPGRQPALWIGGGAAMVAGAVLIAGTLAHSIPCAGPT